ncbi:glycosyltransferase family 4 protein [Rivularia sp. UHCC 0363]|uniref:glycosyltransferase family 4 protein n=1 Tax=Rivularia sp. UHCC 0363 TaxID=3110244 RepID=UPI002B201BB1|nr:glycosyltransferase family 4 protein [Rivularia sp. UHCC 0363]MEA5596127.1 glycosyltransferase family 4 protein [Rivularia sp. UHCC 0363]
MSKSWLVISSDFQPMLGGVAEFAKQIADYFYSKGILQTIITTVSQPEKTSLPIISPYVQIKSCNNTAINFITKKINALSFYLLMAISAIMIVKYRKKSHILFCFVDDLFTPSLIYLASLVGANFHVLFHGKEILHLSQTKPGLLNLICNKSRKILFNSLATKKLFQESTNHKPDNYFILYPGIRFSILDNLAIEKIAALEILPNDSIVISTVCRLVKRKGIHFAIEAFLQLDLDETYKNVYFLIAGDGSEKQYLDNLASKKKDKIFFLGAVTDGQKKNLLLRSSIFIMPNYSVNGTDFEGFGISFTEAAYLGNFVIGGNSGGAIEAVRLCPQGVLVDTDTEEPVPSITEALNEALKLSNRSDKIRTPGINSGDKSLRDKIDLGISIDRLISSLNH